MPALRLPLSITRNSASISKWANAGAWFFIVFSLASVGWALLQQWADPSGTTALYGDNAHHAFGLTYTGVLGLLVALVQTVSVSIATLLSTLRRGRLAGLGHKILIGWSALWMLNLLWLASTDLRVDSFGQAALMTALFGCTVYRATRRPAKKISVTPLEREAAPDEDPIIVAGDEAMTPPAPVASVIEKVKAHAGAPPRRARPAADKAVVRTRNGLKELLTRARPALKSAFDTARQSMARLQTRLQNGWKTTG